MAPLPKKGSKYVPLYVAELTKLHNTISVSGDKILSIQVKSFEDLMKKILLPNVNGIPEDSVLIDMGQTEIYNGVENLKELYRQGAREFVIYDIKTSSVIIPFNSNMGDSNVIVYSPVGKTGYSLSGKC